MNYAIGDVYILLEDLDMRNDNYGYRIQLTDEQKEKIEMAWKDFKEGK